MHEEVDFGLFIRLSSFFNFLISHIIGTLALAMSKSEDRRELNLFFFMLGLKFTYEQLCKRRDTREY